MKDWTKFIEDLKVIFSTYEFIDGDESHNEYGVTKQHVAIVGAYDLNRICEEKHYCERFKLKIVVSKNDNEIIPVVTILDKKPKGFSHTHNNGSCCLGTNLEILLGWEDNRTAQSFFEEIINFYLINLISFRECKEYVTGEREHGFEGIMSYYAKHFPNVPMENMSAFLKYIQKSLKKNEPRSRRTLCPCGSGKEIINCHYHTTREFINNILCDQFLLKAFEDDQEKYINKKRGDRNSRKIKTIRKGS